MSLGSRAAASAAPQGGVEKRSPLKTVFVEAKKESVILRLTGTLEAAEKADVASNVDGIVREVRAERGDRVKKGDLLIQLDSTDARQKLAEAAAGAEALRVRLGLKSSREEFDEKNQPEVRLAYAALKLSEANWSRLNNLHEQNVISQTEFDQANAELVAGRERYEQALVQARQLYRNYLQSLAQLDIRRKAIEDTSIVAPFDAQVLERYASLGEKVMSNPMGSDSKIITLVKIDPLRLALTVPQQDVRSIREGQEVEFQVDSFPGERFKGLVKYISPSVAGQNRALTVEALVANSEGRLMPGMFATAELATGDERTRLYLPASAQFRSGDATMVYVIENDLARRRVIATREAEGGTVEILDGLRAKEEVVADPAQAAENAPVR
ncbi:efflux RND transporter periplasmic adaptor subunit [Candidatus Sumerlaeota bacterium]|nr:efflux RND transporter periplasmic adaptor subunit [Candidatus Sumerlaeota bacterium]